MAISINDFQRISNGTFNVGDITLTSSGKLDKVNNHVGILKSFNKTSIDVQTTLRVKNEFVNALRQSGVSEAELAGVRKELGLGDVDGKGLSLKDLKPLTRAQTREILDRFAKTINGYAGSTIIQNRWAGDEARMASNAELGRTISAATEQRLAKINKGIGESMRNGDLGALPPNLKRDVRALGLPAQTVKNFAAIAGQMLVKSSADVGDIAAAALKKAMLADFGARVPYENKRNMLKTVAEMTDAGTVAELGRILKDAEEAIESGMMEDMVATERFANKDLHPLELRKLKVLDTIDRQLGAIGRDELDASGRAEVLDYMSEWGDIENGECPKLEENINNSVRDYVKESMDGKGVLTYDNDGFCDQFLGDVHRSACTICGTKLDVKSLGTEGTAKKAHDTLMAKFKNVADRKMITSLMNQSAISCFYHMQVGSAGDRAAPDAPPLYKLDPAGSKITMCGDMNDEDIRPVHVAQPVGADLKYSVTFDPKTNTATVRSGVNFRIAASSSNDDIRSTIPEDGRSKLGNVYCECTFTVTGIGTGNPQLAATKISQTFNMNPD